VQSQIRFRIDEDSHALLVALAASDHLDLRDIMRQTFLLHLREVDTSSGTSLPVPTTLRTSTNSKKLAQIRLLIDADARARLISLAAINNLSLPNYLRQLVFLRMQAIQAEGGPNARRWRRIAARLGLHLA